MTAGQWQGTAEDWDRQVRQVMSGQVTGQLCGQDAAEQFVTAQLGQRPPGSLNGQQPVPRERGERLSLLTEEERSMTEVYGARFLDAIGALRHGTQPADIARTLAAASRGLLMWDPKYAEWLAWAGTHWHVSDAGWEDQHRQARRLRDTARRVAGLVRDGLDDSANRLIAPPLDKDGKEVTGQELLDYQRGQVADMLGEVVKKLSSKSMQRDILGQVSSHHHIMAYLDDHDGRRNVLNFTNCTVALDANEWWEHNPADLVTHCLPYSYNPRADCPRFRQLVWEMTGLDGDKSPAHWELYEFVLAVLGYCLIYGNPAQLVFFLTGPTKTGKTTVIEIVATLLGSLAHKSKPALITVSRSGEQHDSVKWSIRGRRLVYVDETKEDMRIDVAGLKDLSGAGTMSVRPLYGKAEVPTPVTFTIVIPTNGMPSMTGGDDAMGERLVRIPCGGATVPVEERDTALKAKIIAAEGEGILALLVAGARRYYRDGLVMPAAVTTASQEYMASQNSVAVFAEERCTGAPLAAGVPASVVRSELRREYIIWCEGVPLGRNEFYAGVRNLHGVGEGKNGQGLKTFTGIRLLTGAGPLAYPEGGW